MKINFCCIKQNIAFKSSNNNQSKVSLPNATRNFTMFDQKHVEDIVSKREQALPALRNTLKTSTDEKEIVETLYIIDRMLDAGVKGIPALYPDLAKFNDTKSPNIQVFLAGIYRKTQVPDAFGPLCAMLIKNSINDAKNSDVKQSQSVSSISAVGQKKTFDPNEEIGGAILEYIRNYSHIPTQGARQINYSA